LIIDEKEARSNGSMRIKIKGSFLPIVVLLSPIMLLAGCGTSAASNETVTGFEERIPLHSPQSPSPAETIVELQQELFVNLDFGMFGEIETLPYMVALTEAYIAEYDGASIDFAVVSRDEALELFQSGQAQAVVVTGETQGGVLVAYQCLGVAVHPDNPITELDRGQIFRIFSGEIDNWQEFGLDDAPITIYATDRYSASRQAFENILSLKSTTDGIAKSLVPDTAVVLPDDSSVAEAILADINGIGILWAGETPSPVNFVSIDSVALSCDSIADGSYGLSRPVVLMASGDTEALLEFAACVKMTEIARGLGFWPVT